MRCAFGRGLLLVPIIAVHGGLEVCCVGGRICDIRLGTEYFAVPVATIFRIEPVVGVLKGYVCQVCATVERILSNHRNTFRYRYTSQTCAAGKRIVVDNCNAFRYRYACQTRATVERIVVDNCNVFRYGYACQTRATVERIAVDPCNAVGECYTLQVCAAAERIVVDPCNAIRNRYTRQAGAVTERVVFDGCKAVWKRYARQAGAVLEGIALENCATCDCCADQGWGSLRDYGRYVIRRTAYASQACATGKGIFSNTCDAIRYRYTRQSGATLKGFVSDTRDAIRDDYTCQTGAVLERIAIDTCDGFRDDYTRQVRAGECTTWDARTACDCCADRSGVGLFDYGRYVIHRAGYTCQAGTALERISKEIYVRNTIRDGYARQTGAVFKRIIADACYAIRDCYTCQAGAVLEGIVGDIFCAGCNFYCCVSRHGTFVLICGCT